MLANCALLATSSCRCSFLWHFNSWQRQYVIKINVVPQVNFWKSGHCRKCSTVLLVNRSFTFSFLKMAIYHAHKTINFSVIINICKYANREDVNTSVDSLSAAKKAIWQELCNKYAGIITKFYKLPALWRTVLFLMTKVCFLFRFWFLQFFWIQHSFYFLATVSA